MIIPAKLTKVETNTKALCRTVLPDYILVLTRSFKLSIKKRGWAEQSNYYSTRLGGTQVLFSFWI
jgi:hypothetical protein